MKILTQANHKIRPICSRHDHTNYLWYPTVKQLNVHTLRLNDIQVTFYLSRLQR